jgi:hypothetical protein
MRGDMVNWEAFVKNVISITIHRQYSQVDFQNGTHSMNVCLLKLAGHNMLIVVSSNIVLTTVESIFRGIILKKLPDFGFEVVYSSNYNCSASNFINQIKNVLFYNFDHPHSLNLRTKLFKTE